MTVPRRYRTNQVIDRYLDQREFDLKALEKLKSALVAWARRHDQETAEHEGSQWEEDNTLRATIPDEWLEGK